MNTNVLLQKVRDLEERLAKVEHLNTGGIEVVPPLFKDEVMGQGGLVIRLDESSLDTGRPAVPIIAYTSLAFTIPASTGGIVPIAITTATDTTIWMVNGQTILITDGTHTVYGSVTVITDTLDFSFALGRNATAIPAPWSSTAFYVVGQEVLSGGLSYTCIVGNHNNVPPNAFYWKAGLTMAAGAAVIISGDAVQVWSLTQQGILTTTTQTGAGEKTTNGSWSAYGGNESPGISVTSKSASLVATGVRIKDTPTDATGWIGNHAWINKQVGFNIVETFWTNLTTSQEVTLTMLPGTSDLADPGGGTRRVVLTTTDTDQLPTYSIGWGSGTDVAGTKHVDDGDYFVNCIGDIFEGGLHTGHYSVDPNAATGVVLYGSGQKIAKNATTATVYGSGFSTTTANDSVTFQTMSDGTTPTATVTAATANSLTLTFGVNPTTTGWLVGKVTVSGSDSSLNLPFGLIVPAPTLSTATVAVGPGQTSVTLTGTGFSNGMTWTSTSNGNPTGTITGVNSAGTSATLTLTSSPSTTGTLSGKVTSNGGVSNTTTVLTVTTPSPGPSGPSLTPSTSSILQTATSLTIQGGPFFDKTTPGNNTVALYPTGTGTVTAATSTALTVTSVTGLTPGPLYAIVTTNGVTSGAKTQVGTVIGTPNVTASSAFTSQSSSSNIATNTTSLTFGGTGFDNTSTVALTSTGTITVVTNTTPIGITSSNHGLSTGMTVVITGDTAAGTWVVTKTGTNTFTLNGSSASGSDTTGTWVATYANTVTNVTPTSITLTVTGGPFATGPLKALVTTQGQNSGSSTQIGTVVSVSITPSTTSVPSNATSVTLTVGSADPTAASNNSFTFDNATVTGGVTWVNPLGTSVVLTVTSGTLPLGALTGILKSYGGGSTSQEICYVVTTDPPIITLTTTNIAYNAGTITVTGLKFDPTAGNNTGTFNLGVTGTCTAATLTSSTWSISNANANGSLTLTVTTAYGGTDVAGAVQVGTVTGVVSHAWYDTFTESVNTILQSHTPNVGSGGYTKTSTDDGTVTGGVQGWTNLANAPSYIFNPGSVLRTASYNFKLGSGFDEIAFRFRSNAGATNYWALRITTANMNLQSDSGSGPGGVSVSLSTNTLYTMTLTDDGTNMSATVNATNTSFSSSTYSTNTYAQMYLSTMGVNGTRIVDLTIN